MKAASKKDLFKGTVSDQKGLPILLGKAGSPFRHFQKGAVQPGKIEPFPKRCTDARLPFVEIDQINISIVIDQNIVCIQIRMEDVCIVKKAQTPSNTLPQVFRDRARFQKAGQRMGHRHHQGQQIRTIIALAPYHASGNRLRNGKTHLEHPVQELPFPPGACPRQTQPKIAIMNYIGKDSPSQVMTQDIAIFSVGDKVAGSASFRLSHHLSTTNPCLNFKQSRSCFCKERGIV